MSDMRRSPEPARWIEEGTENEADCRVFQIERRRFRHPSKAGGTDFYVVNAPDWVMALAETTDGRWILVRQFRFGQRDLTWEFPSGTVEPGEDPILAARRELEEETGYVAEECVPLGTVKPNPAIMDNTCHFFLFPNVHPTGAIAWDEHEEIGIGLASMADIVRWSTDGTIVHSLVHAGLFLYNTWRDRGQPT